MSALADGGKDGTARGRRPSSCVSREGQPASLERTLDPRPKEITMSRKTLIVSCLSLLAVFSCSSHKRTPTTVPKIDAPEWYSDPARDDDRLIGVATAASKDLQTAVDKAKQD